MAGSPRTITSVVYGAVATVDTLLRTRRDRDGCLVISVAARAPGTRGRRGLHLRHPLALRGRTCPLLRADGLGFIELRSGEVDV
jgi:hypothetical protein